MKVAIGLIWMCGLAALPANAHADSGLTVRLTAHVSPFCRIYPPADDEIELRNGSAIIGDVREICNTPSGYDVSATFSNLASGTLDVGGLDYMLVNGVVSRSSNEPAVRTMAWSLSDAQLAQTTLPVVMQVTISPR